MTTMENSYNALVIEDTPEFAEVVRFTLKHLGISAILVDSGPDALKYLDNEIPDLIVLDLGLPGMGGWDVLTQVHAMVGRHSIPVIITTAYGDRVNRAIGHLQHVHDYLVKPFQPYDLMDSVNTALELHKYAKH